MKYKAVPVRHFSPGRVVSTQSETDPYHYGLVAGQPENQEFFQLAIELSEEYGIPLGNFALCAIAKSISDDEDFWNGNMPSPRDLERLDCEVENVQFERDAEVVVGLREAVIERAREIAAPGEPSRLESLFACDNLEDVQRYREMHGLNSPRTHVVCEVVEIRSSGVFRGDMLMLDKLELETMDSTEAIEQASHYWRGEVTSTPLMETLLQGEYKFADLRLGGK